MNIEKIYEELLKTIDSSKILKNESMAKHTSFKIGGNADIVVKAKTIEDIKNVLEVVESNNVPLCVIGNGSNILVRDNGIRGIILIVEIETYNITKKENNVSIEVGAGVKLSKLAYDLLKENIQGFEFASRNTWNNWWCNIYECGSAWKRNERHSTNHYIHRLHRKNKHNFKQTTRIFI